MLLHCCVCLRGRLGALELLFLFSTTPNFQGSWLELLDDCPFCFHVDAIHLDDVERSVDRLKGSWHSMGSSASTSLRRPDHREMTLSPTGSIFTSPSHSLSHMSDM